MGETKYRERSGVIIALTFLALGAVPAVLASTMSGWWLVLALPLVGLGGLGLGVELSRPKRL